MAAKCRNITYILDGDQTVAVNENIAIKYWHILANGVFGKRDATGNTFYYLMNHLGSTRAVVNSSGAVVEAHDYAVGIPLGLPVWPADARQGLPERQRDEGEVYGEGKRQRDRVGLFWGAVLLGYRRQVVECGCFSTQVHRMVTFSLHLQ